MRRIAFAVACFAVSATAVAGDMNITVEIPTLKVAEYHRPYVAVWLEREDHTVAANLAVWYDVKKADGEGTKWLKDMRQWWRRTGREQTMPIDGVSGATRPAGQHQLKFVDGKAPLGTLPPGKYELVVEAAREVGGREMQRIPFEWPVKASAHLSAQGKDELGLISLDLNP
ncbi:hypothetical protein FHW69_000367 [Luteibacter sp. Sphag1AF]|uniref:DUF2271 domain-containing protein n=1 Tax=Luteibacter sp. Sphag1AF TaxID=2587031 RepID=UPI00161181BD|nr:DUF2271 domain-containing protein [Luteibacter sp. Sphag1AF]MBB3225777.1 hypothetical protein [Luteibacter sp. Sphag1AF]